MIFGHQGDVFFRPAGNLGEVKLGEPLKVEDNGGITLVEGELTGHHHQFRDVDAVEIRPVLNNKNEEINAFLVKVKKPTDLVHYNVITKDLTREHNAVSFPPGEYIIGNQRQMSTDLTIQRAID